MSEREMNQKIAERICNELRWNGREFRRGEGVALLDGEILAVEKDLDGAARALWALQLGPDRGLVFEVGPQVDYIR